MITNSHRSKQLEEFLDKPHPIMEKYYDLLETPTTEEYFKNQLRYFIETDPEFFDPYHKLVDLLLVENKPDEAKQLLQKGFECIMQKIVDKEGNWPKKMPWAWLENRHMMRLIDRYAHMLWAEGNNEAALDLFRRLLHVNCGDNQGARYEILAIRLGLKMNWEEPFILTEGPMAGAGLDAMELDQWFQENAKRFPDEFDWLFRTWKKENRL